MKRKTVLLLAVGAALGLAFIPLLVPAGPAGSDAVTGLLANGHLWLALAAIFLGGLGTSLTPCVYPLIPITVGVFGARQAESRGKAFLLTSLYVLGMGVVFSGLGLMAGLSGKAFGSVLGNVWVGVGLALFMFALAASMFGAFELALPPALATRLNTVGGKGYLGALLMGSVAGLLAAPCTGPALTGVLVLIAKTQDPVLGAGLLFVYALGIGVPFFLIGVFAVRLPKSGEWMEWVKSGFGVALVALGVAYLRDSFTPFGALVRASANSLGFNTAVAVAAAIAFAGTLAGAVHYSFKAPEQRLLKGLGVTALVAAFLLRMAATPPFAWALQFSPEQAPAGTFQAAVAQAKKDCKPVMVDFSADWCAACKELDHRTYVAAEVAEEARRFVAIKVDGTKDNEILDRLYEEYGVKGLPTVAFMDPDGKVLEAPKVTGFLPPGEFVAQLRKIPAATACAGNP